MFGHFVSFLGHFCKCWQILVKSVHFSIFWSLWAFLAHLGTFGSFWHFLELLAHFGQIRHFSHFFRFFARRGDCKRVGILLVHCKRVGILVADARDTHRNFGKKNPTRLQSTRNSDTPTIPKKMKKGEKVPKVAN